jgi:histidinol-phosphate aminotransferase
VAKYPNVVVLQTLSKAFGLACIRLGMAFAREDAIQLMNNIKAPYNINKLTAEVAGAALQNLDLYRTNVAAILEERKFLIDGIRALMPMVKKIFTRRSGVLKALPNAESIYLLLVNDCSQFIRKFFACN